MTDFRWADELSCAITVCDIDANVVYQNDKACKTFEKYGNLIGKNLKECHGEKSWKMILEMLESGKSNTYTIDKKGIKKMIHQTPWFQNGKLMGLVEFSIELPNEMPHFIR